jgi:sensor histidine kinase regulating citrate/malate metabolism
VEALRANNHEFLNKLHVILGLIQLNKLDEAKKFIAHVTERQQHVLSHVMKNIKDTAVAALILGKISRAKELGIELRISEDSFLEMTKGKITGSSIVTIIGNLIENAMDSFNTSNKEIKEIRLTVREDDNTIFLRVEDNGEGIKKDNLNSIFLPGFSTKEGNRGRGLPKIKRIIENLGGNIEVASEEKIGTTFEVTLTKEGSNDN